MTMRSGNCATISPPHKSGVYFGMVNPAWKTAFKEKKSCLINVNKILTPSDSRKKRKNPSYTAGVTIHEC